MHVAHVTWFQLRKMKDETRENTMATSPRYDPFQRPNLHSCHAPSHTSGHQRWSNDRVNISSGRFFIDIAVGYVTTQAWPHASCTLHLLFFKQYINTYYMPSLHPYGRMQLISLAPMSHVEWMLPPYLFLTSNCIVSSLWAGRNKIT